MSGAPGEMVAPEPIAVIGIGCRFPKASGVAAFWRLLHAGVDAIGEPPEGRPSAARGGYLEALDGFDRAFFGLSLAEARALDPRQRLLLEVAWEALEDAGLPPALLAGSDTSAFVGLSDAAGTVEGARAAAHGLALMQVLDLRGASLSVDAGSASSLAAVHLACQSLRSGESTLAIAGGASALFERPGHDVGPRSPRARCSPFDAAADGAVPGEGVGVVILKRLSLARADGDRVYALIRGSAVRQVGRGAASIARSQAAQVEVLRAAYRDARVSPERVRYVEAHGTGVSEEDAAEVQALAAVLGSNPGPEGGVRLGSVKGNLGHLEAAAGVAGLIKLALSLHHGALVPTPHHRVPGRALAGLPLRVQQGFEPWSGARGAIAGVSAFSAGGAHVHAVLEGMPAEVAPDAAQPGLLSLSARSPEALRTVARAHLERSEQGAPESLDAICYTAGARRAHHPYRLALPALDGARLREGFRAFLAGGAAPGLSVGRALPGVAPRLVFVFSGEVSQLMGAGRALLAREPVFREELERCDALLRPLTGWSLLEELGAEQPRSRLGETEIARTALFALQAGLVALWRSWGIAPDAVIGHGAGEVAAAYASGALTLDQALRVSYLRGLATRQAGGRVAAVELSPMQAMGLLQRYPGRLWIAAFNSPSSLALAGDEAALLEAVAELEQEGNPVRLMSSQNDALHTPAVEPLGGKLAEALAGLAPSAPRIPMISTATGLPITEASLDAAYWARQLCLPVQFSQAVTHVVEQGHTLFVEVGLQPELQADVVELLRIRGVEGLALVSLRRGEDARVSLLASLGALYVRGHDVRWSALHSVKPLPVSLPAAPWEHERCGLPALGRAVPVGAPDEVPEVAPAKASEAPSRKEEEEQWRAVVEWNQTSAEYRKDTTLGELFEQQVERTPDAVALLWEGGELKYGELNRRANRLAHYLRRLGVGPEVVVGLCATRTAEMVVGMVGVMKAGGAYVPLDAAYPRERLALVLEETQAPVVLVEQGLEEKLPASGARVVMLKPGSGELAGEAESNPEPRARAENLAYLLFTSGSTGRPKGVQGHHQGIINRLEWMWRTYPFAPGEVCCQKTALSFGDAVCEVMGPLLRGVPAVLLRDEEVKDIPRLVRVLEARGVTRLVLVPSLLQAMLDEDEARARLSKLKLWTTSGEKLPQELAELFRESQPHATLLNLYGSTEIAADATGAEVHEGEEVTIGRPLANVKAYVLDGALRPVPAGTRGELYIGGDGVARGYLRRPDLTAERFLPDAYSGEPGRRLYRTGDVVRHLTDGRLEYLGRQDAQVKVRGFRIELGEVEAALAQHPALKESAVVVREDTPGNKRLVAYAVAALGLKVTAQELKGFLQEKLPEFMVPPAYVVMDALPRTPGGKVDRKALPVPEAFHAEAESFLAPRTTMEELVAGVWGQLLGLERVGAEDDFFALGGHSLNVMQALASLEDVLHVELPLSSLFEASTVASLARLIEDTLEEARKKLAPPLVSVDRGAALPLSFAQQRLWFLDQFESSGAAYHVPLALRLKGRLDVVALERALDQIVRRQESLRTTFALEGEQPGQRVAPAAPVRLAVADFGALPDSQREAEAKRHAEEELARPFELTQGPLFRATLLRLSAEEHVLVMVMHHIVTDGWSLHVLLRELMVLYLGAAPEVLPALAVQYADFAQWQREWLSGGVLDKQLVYWRKRLDGVPPLLELPVDYPRPALQSFRGAHRWFPLPRALTDALKELSRREGTTLFMTLLAAFQALLSRYSGQKDVVVGSPIAGRNRREVEHLVGFFVNTLVLRTDLSGSPSFHQLLGRVRETCLGAYANQDVPFEQLVETLHPVRDLSRTPLFQVMFILQSGSTPALELPRLSVSEVELDSGAVKFDLTLSLQESAGGISVLWAYSTDLFAAGTIERMAAHYERLLEAVVEQPERRVEEVALLAGAERRLVLEEWNRTEAAFPSGTRIHELFEAQVRRTPGAEALVHGALRLTYAELNRRANKVAAFLRAQGVGPEGVVGVCAERTVEMVVGMLGILKAGGAYLPMDPAYPRERLGFLLEDAAGAVLLTQRRVVERLPAYEGRVECLDEWDWREGGEEDVRSPGSGENLAYVIYTSGSTGRPKGVGIRHHSAVVFLEWVKGAFSAEEMRAVLAATSICFDLSVFELFGALAMGGKVVLAENALALPELEAAGEVTLINTVPSAMAQLVKTGGVPGGVKVVNLAGEALAGALVREVYGLGTVEKVFNLYGPSEDTTYSTYALMGRGDERPSIGRPLSNTQAYVLDERLEPVPVGVTGELYLSGEGLARGYLKRPGLTAEKFIPNPFGDGKRMYRTGDLARYRADGVLEYQGRGDTQVKVRGFRIELGEVEAALAKQEGVRDCVVVVREETPGSKRLVAYLVANEGKVLEVAALRAALKEKLPEYMVPSTFVVLAALPLTPNGKVDRKRLPSPEGSRKAREYEAPRTPVEKALAGVWASVLRVEKVGRDENFFEVGGDSIVSLQIVARARQAGLHFTSKQLFQKPTVGELAAVVVESRATLGEQGAVTGEAKLTPIQRWFFEQELPQAHHFNQALMLEARSPVEAALLEQALRRLVAHHDALRMRYVREGGAWTQLHSGVEPGPALLRREDVSALADAAQREAIEKAAGEVQGSFSLGEGPLLKAALFERGEGRTQRVLLVAHHLVVDFVSWRVLVEDLNTAYGQLRRAEAVALPAKTTSFKAWAEKLEAHAGSEQVEREAAYWLAEARLGAVPLPVDKAGGANTLASARRISVWLDAEETRALLQEAPAAYRAHINDVLLAALGPVLAKWTGGAAVLVDLEGHGREELFADVDVSRTVGWFTSLFPVLLEAAPEDGPGEAVRRVKEAMREMPGRGLGYGLLKYLGRPALSGALRASSRAQVSFNYLGQLGAMASDGAVFGLVREPTGPSYGQEGPRSHVLEVSGLVLGDRLELVWVYSDGLHEARTIEALARDYLAALRALIAHRGSEDAARPTPSDFPLAHVERGALELILQQHPRIDDLYPLSPMQQGILFHALLEPGSGVYFEHPHWTFHAALDVAALRRAWQAVVAGNPVLRTAFLWEGLAEPLQVVQAEVELPWQELDWRGLDEAGQQARMESFLAGERARGFELGRAPLMRVAVIRLDARVFRLVWSFHHLLLDGWSVGLVLGELLARYEAFAQGHTLQLDPTPRFRDYIGWLRRQDSARAEAYWREALEGFTAATPLPVDRAAIKGEAQGDAERELVLPASTAAALGAFARQHQLTLNTLVMGAWALVLGRYSGEADVVVGATVAGRAPELPGVESMVGLLINAVPVRIKLAAEERLVPWLRQLQARQAELRQYEHSPLVQVQGWSEVPRGQALFDCLYAFENQPMAASARERMARVGLGGVKASVRTNYLLTALLIPGEELVLRLLYKTPRFEARTIARLLEHWRAALEAMTAQPEQRVGQVSLLAEEERRRVLLEWNDTGAEFSRELTLPDFFERQVERTPDAVALLWDGGQLTYRALSQRANQLAHHLRALGVGPETVVGTCVTRSPEMVVAIIAVLKAGGAYVPLEPTYPRERLQLILDETRAPVVLTQEHLLPLLPSSAARVVVLDSDWPEVAKRPDTNPARQAVAANLAYLLFTSGSTGKPKGVLGHHRGMVNRFEWMWKRYPFQPGEVCCQKTALSFGDAVWEVLGPLFGGAPLVLLADEVVKDIPRLLSLLEARGVTRLVLVPSLLHAMLEEEDAGRRLAKLRLVTVSGEKLPEELAARFHARLPGAELLNLYGATEVAADATGASLRAGEVTTIGRPLSNVRAYVLGAALEAVPVGVRGELYIGGECVARGYLDQPELTAERFLPDPYTPEPGARMYRTGDVVRHLPDGRLEYLGRRDAQVKVRGFRIELGEVEAALSRHPGLKESAVVVREDVPGNQRLVAYAVAAPGMKPEAKELRAFMLVSLPDFMVPSAFVTLEALPRTAGGKLARKALPAPESVRAEDEPFLMPRSATEQLVADIWREILKIDKVGATDNFFTLGGHSLLATQVVSRVRVALQVELSMRQVFESPTVEALAQVISRIPRQLLSEPGPIGASAQASLLENIDQLSEASLDALLRSMEETGQTS